LPFAAQLAVLATVFCAVYGHVRASCATSVSRPVALRGTEPGRGPTHVRIVVITTAKRTCDELAAEASHRPTRRRAWATTWPRPRGAGD